MRTKGEKIYAIFNNTALILLGLICLVPYLTLFAKSFSAEAFVVAGEVYLWPKGFNWMAYEVLIGSNAFLSALKNSIIITVTGTIIQVFFTLCVGYVCSKDKLPGSRLLTRLYVFAMLFSGGMIPTFMVIRFTGLMNTFWAVIVPGMVGSFNMFMARNYFYTIPDSLEESAKIDGAGNLRVFFSIMLPMAIPSVATITIFTCVGLWNNYMGPLMYLNRSDVKPLSVYLKDIVTASDMQSLEGTENFQAVASESFRAAAIFVSTLPILCVYPFLQKYFIVGMKMGSVKE